MRRRSSLGDFLESLSDRMHAVTLAAAAHAPCNSSVIVDTTPCGGRRMEHEACNPSEAVQAKALPMQLDVREGNSRGRRRAARRTLQLLPPPAAPLPPSLPGQCEGRAMME